MSTTYFVVCDKCKQALGIAQWTCVFQFYALDIPEEASKVKEFLQVHTLCSGDLRILQEGLVFDHGYSIIGLSDSAQQHDVPAKTR